MDKSAILSFKPRVEMVDMPDGTKTAVRGMTFDEIMGMSKSGPGNGDLAILLYCVVDNAGKPMFDESDLPALKAASIEIILPLMKAAKRLMAMDDDEKKAPAVNS